MIVDADRHDGPGAAPGGPASARRERTGPVVYTVEEAATILRVRPSWLERRAAERKIPFTMLGGSYRFTDSHLAQIVEMFEMAPARREEHRPARRGRRPAPVAALATAGLGGPLRPRPRPAPQRAV
jgi:excisionase family DNA binding protein